MELAGFQGITQAVAGLKAAAAVGFTITDDGAQQLISALQEVHTEVMAGLATGQILGTHLPLGDTPVANVAKPFVAATWTDPVQGGQAVLTQLKQDLEDAMDTIKKNSASYQAAEAQNTSGLKSV